MHLVSYEEVANINELADTRCPATLLMQKEEEAARPVMGRNGLSTGGLMKLADFIAEYPEVWRTVREKIQNPNVSYQQLADTLGTTKMTVCRHLKFASTEIPEISKALLIDTRFRKQ